MKKSFLIAFLGLTGFSTYAQNVNLSAYGAYAFNSKFDSYYDPYEYYNGEIKGGFQWGVGVEFRVQPAVGLELSYFRQDTHSPTTYLMPGQLVVKTTDFDLDINYIMLGGNKYFRAPNSQFEGFGGLSAGIFTAGLSNPDNGNESNVTKFAWGGKLGGIFWASESVGIKLQMQFLSAVQAVGGGFYFGSGGVATGVSSYSTIFQFSLGGGLVFSLD
ncbi:hypothetical protein K8352_07130 [Flavobacteriaceae bacterium F89]|uniref:Outer membrane protein beta-barrel domain-containing protein n=1 Tax=Cerina litoralis TaxID=2874477 RepID=A0AAE3JN31_9FLAO|nr:hypothetical protein [Cerina litoralis]MCG2460515.1 hypothetical protein [Cerina litoralis]